MVHILRTSPTHPAYKYLVGKLDAELAITDGKDHAFYDKFNKSDHIKYAIVLFEKDEPIGCGAIRNLSQG